MTSGCGDEPAEGTGGIVVFNMRGTVRNFGTDTPIAGVELCPTELEGYDCATTDADGDFEIFFPKDADSYLTATHPDYPRHLMHVQPIGGIPFQPLMLSQAQVDAATAAAGGSPDPSAGHILIVANNGEVRLNGITARVGGGSGLDPVYFDGFQEPDEQLPASTANGAAFIGNVPTGVKTVFTDHPDLECFVPSRSQDGSGVPFLFEAGTVSVSDEWECQPPAAGETSG